jgi:hypothetical protein
MVSPIGRWSLLGGNGGSLSGGERLLEAPEKLAFNKQPYFPEIAAHSIVFHQVKKNDGVTASVEFPRKRTSRFPNF